ncbi:hypothetical protein Trco_002974 [Trichoderma cornu-damae]|uniref:Telomere length regulation/capping, TEN1 n=1 Tax=Trichoderma cornu-damae TaxID=654480 RepID=A0A9P8QVR3_9HYPO|nr:hypothetical protein Trco_002974 [Trichoderma cornu-damae]
MSWGPVPSQLWLLSQLKDCSVGDKVRFLGCVLSYDTSTACLSLGHMYPPGTNETVFVNIQLILETLQPGLTQVGQWVNVVGYIMERTESDALKDKEPGKEASPVLIQALLMWSTGPLDIGRWRDPDALPSSEAYEIERAHILRSWTAKRKDDKIEGRSARRSKISATAFLLATPPVDFYAAAWKRVPFAWYLTI